MISTCFFFFILYCKIAKMNYVIIIRRYFVCFRSFFCCWAIVLAIYKQFKTESIFKFACSALFFETLACLIDFLQRRTRYLFNYWTFVLRWCFVDAKMTTCCVLNFVTIYIYRLFNSLKNFSFLNAWCFSKSLFFWIKISFIEKQKNDVDDMTFSSLNIC
jgi:hypothetical protein